MQTQIYAGTGGPPRGLGCETSEISNLREMRKARFRAVTKICEVCGEFPASLMRFLSAKSYYQEGMTSNSDFETFRCESLEI